METEKLVLGLHGASGRMGLRLVQLAAADPDVQLVLRAGNDVLMSKLFSLRTPLALTGASHAGLTT